MAYEPDPDYDASYDYRDQREGSRQGSTLWRTALIGAGVIIALVAVFFAYRSGQAPTAGDAPPLITADGGPIKIAPSEPGGMDIPNQDKMILNKGASQPEQLLPPPEQPVLPTVEASSPVEPAIPEPAIPAPPVPASPVPAQTAALQPETPAMPATPAAPAAADAVAAVPAAPPTASAAKAGGAVMVQFAALKDKAAADQAWTRLTKMHADLLGGLQPSIEPVTVNGNKLFRLRAVGLSDGKVASALCAKMKERKQDCTVVR